MRTNKKRISKFDFIDRVFEETKKDDIPNLYKNQVDAVYKAIFKQLKEELLNSNSVCIPAFGTFEVYERKATTGVNPQTQEKINIPAKKAVRFTLSEQFINILRAEE